MDKKENQRVALTKRLVREALLLLMQKKPINKISIRELCEKAGINRSTFYNHYGSQYDVLDEISGIFLDEIAAVIENAQLDDKESVYGRVTLVLKYIEENIELSKLLFTNNIDPTFSTRLFSLPKITELLENALIDAHDIEYNQAAAKFIIFGSYKLIQDWINVDNRASSEEQSRLMLALAGKVCN